jgi:SAM-dependent methyltransferase
MTSIKPSTNHAETIYDEISKTYEEKYVAGGFQNSYMVDEFHAKTWWLWSRLKGRIVSLGVGSGQDIEILGHPDPADFTGYDISEGMLANARQKFPAYADRLIHHDCQLHLPAVHRLMCWSACLVRLTILAPRGCLDITTISIARAHFLCSIMSIMMMAWRSTLYTIANETCSRSLPHSFLL